MGEIRIVEFLRKSIDWSRLQSLSYLANMKLFHRLKFNNLPFALSQNVYFVSVKLLNFGRDPYLVFTR